MQRGDVWKPSSIFSVLDHFKNKKKYNEGVEADPSQLYDVPDYFKTQKMCDDVVRMDSYSLLFLPDWFVTLKQLEIWHDDDGYCNDDQIIG